MSAPEEPRSAERMVFFSDAVVAIAMTLLILPLMESVSEAATEGLDAAQWWHEHTDQIMAFTISFVLVGTFWRAHHILYEHIERYTPMLMTLNLGWLFTVVSLPVATAISGQLETDAVNMLVYVGTLLATALVSVVTQAHVLRHPELWRDDNPMTSRGIVINAVLAGLLVIALVVGTTVPGLGYQAMFVLLLMWPLSAFLSRRLGGPSSTDARSGNDPAP